MGEFLTTGVLLNLYMDECMKRLYYLLCFAHFGCFFGTNVKLENKFQKFMKNMANV
jgi:hypothetical protein